MGGVKWFETEKLIVSGVLRVSIIDPTRPNKTKQKKTQKQCNVSENKCN